MLQKFTTFSKNKPAGLPISLLPLLFWACNLRLGKPVFNCSLKTGLRPVLLKYVYFQIHDMVYYYQKQFRPVHFYWCCYCFCRHPAIMFIIDLLSIEFSPVLRTVSNWDIIISRVTIHNKFKDHEKWPPIHILSNGQSQYA